MTTFAELNAAQLATHALNIFIAEGRHIEGARVIYRALQLDPHEPDALRSLSDFHASSGTEAFSAATMEYALSGAIDLSTEERQKLEALHFLDIWTWGFARHSSGEAQLSAEAFKNRDDFEVDHAAYAAFLGTIVEPAGSPQAAFQAAHRLSGLMAGFLQHASNDNPDLDTVLRGEGFVETPEYAQWLQSSTDDLDALDKAIQEQRQKG
ncbi:hypothetical protein [Stenotrophomonas sp. PFBMAA-4]|uniref:hypothetical protein n=1 Tax=Stenotrophomonas sp. PFBMAA-4 TaxID=3043301 RepID=UPI0024B5E9CE|nr:hypothetical protein [Stenotrophomonas sp. PFBMAA-4]MDI9224893.1 hypothetical protein [Serratia bockelmannii]MDI9273557.1 hypothetical protein [Stenotrophomonas sp. PFBMAA-4]